MTPPATTNLRLRPSPGDGGRAGLDWTTDATIEDPLEYGGQEHRRGAKSQDDAAIQRANRESYPSPPERVLVGHHGAHHFEPEQPSVHAACPAGQAGERQPRA